MESLLSDYDVTLAQLVRLRDAYGAELELGLSRGVPDAAIAMLPSFLPELPDGSEKGKYLGLDLGGTNLRVLRLMITPGKPLDLKSRNYEISKAAMTGPGTQLFDYVVEKLIDFLKEEKLLAEKLSLGFVFSYPCHQLGLRHAELLWWTKGFTCPDTVGHDVVAMLQTAIDKQPNLNVKVQAIMNDTVGCLLASAYENGADCLIGGVVSTGCNVSYLETTERITKFDAAEANYKFPKMIVDTEWEEQGNQGFFSDIETEIDRIVDQQSTYKGKQTQDKYISGLHMGEHVRLLLLKAAKENIPALNDRSFVSCIEKEHSFLTEFVSTALSDESLNGSKAVLAKLGVLNASAELCKALQMTCAIVSKRSAGVLAVALSALIQHIDAKQLKIDESYHLDCLGMLAKQTPKERGSGHTVRTLPSISQANLSRMWLLSKIFIQPIRSFRITLRAPPHLSDSAAEVATPTSPNTNADGSGKGAALAAAIAEKLNI